MGRASPRHATLNQTLARWHVKEVYIALQKVMIKATKVANDANTDAQHQHQTGMCYERQWHAGRHDLSQHVCGCV